MAIHSRQVQRCAPDGIYRSSRARACRSQQLRNHRCLAGCRSMVQRCAALHLSLNLGLLQSLLLPRACSDSMQWQ
jgi:hypothetical protein